MGNVKNSVSLDKLIEYAKTVGKKSVDDISAERFVFAVCELVEGKLIIGEIDNNGRKNLVKVFNKFCANFQKLKENLSVHIKNESTSTLFMDNMYFQEKILQAKTKLSIDNCSTLTPGFLLECILNEPTGFIKHSIININKKYAGNASKYNKTTSDRKIEEEFDKSFANNNQGAFSTGAQDAEISNILTNPKYMVAQLTDRVKYIRKELLSAVHGQDNAVDIFTNGYFQSEWSYITDKKRVRPSATFLFAGPPGVGKTFLAEKAAEKLNFPFMRFDMSEYSNYDCVTEFCGSDRVYKDAKRGNVTEFVASKPRCVLLFDEIEKANLSIIHLFLQILDADRLRDKFTNTEVSFADAIIIFTTNAGRQLYERSESDDLSAVSRKVILKALQDDRNTSGNHYFPAEICSRFASGNVVMFNIYPQIIFGKSQKVKFCVILKIMKKKSE